MASNLLKWEESSEIVLDNETLSPAVGWTLNYVSVIRIGGVVVLHVEAAFAAAAAAPVATLPAQFRPDATVTTPDGKFTLTAAGVLSFTASTAGGGSSVAQLNFYAAEVSP